MEKISDVLKLAITNEVKAKVFYRKASEATDDGESQMMFIELTEMEDEHGRRLVRLFGDRMQKEGTDAQAFLEKQQARADEVLEVAEHDMLKSGDMRKVIERAMQLELRARDTYAGLKEQVDTDDLRRICDELAAEEQKHHDMLASLRTNVDTPIDERPALG